MATAPPLGAPLTQEALATPAIFVRRLYKPRLLDQVAIGAGDFSGRSSSLNRVLPGGEGHALAAASVRPHEVPQSNFLLQTALALPEEFGKIYLGETFRAYVSVVNSLNVTIIVQEAQVSLKSSRSAEVMLNTLSQGPSGPGSAFGGSRVRELGRTWPRELRPGENLDVVVEHMLQELDWHYLAIKLEFRDPRSAELRPMMKRFKFKVYNPVALTTTTRVVPHTKHVLVQAQVKNITERYASLHLEDVSILPEDGLQATRVKPTAVGSAPPPSSERCRPTTGPEAPSDLSWDPGDAVAAFDRHVYLQPDDVVHFMYLLERSETYKGRTMAVAPGVTLGQLRVSWRTTLGESGTLLSPRVVCAADGVPLHAAALAARPVELVVDDQLPTEMVQGQVYHVKCSLANNTDKELRLQVQFHLESMQGVYITGRAFHNAGLVPAHSKRPVSISLLPLMAGLHDVKGLTIVDLVTSQEFDQGHLCEVLVVCK